MDLVKRGISHHITGSLLSGQIPPAAEGDHAAVAPFSPDPSPYTSRPAAEAQGDSLASQPDTDLPLSDTLERLTLERRADLNKELEARESKFLDESQRLPVQSEDPSAFVEIELDPVGPSERLRFHETKVSSDYAVPIRRESKDSAAELSDPTEPYQGLSNADAAAKLAEVGFNELEKAKVIPFGVHFLMQFLNPLILLLLFAVIASIAVGNYAEGVAILVTVLLICLFGATTEHSADNVLHALAALGEPNATVIREGETVVVPSRNLVPGDFVVLETGNVVPADLRLLRSSELRVNEMALTGETVDVSKMVQSKQQIEQETHLLTPKNMCFMSTNVSSGHAVGLVVATGMNTRMGKIAQLLMDTQPADATSAQPQPKQLQSLNQGPPASAESAPKKVKKPKWYSRPQTPLQRSLNRLAFLLGSIGISICILVFIIGTSRGYSDPQKPDSPTVLTMLVVAVSLAVSAVPEGLPLVVSIALALGSLRLSKLNMLVRKLPAVETLGATRVICTDKTGTLTEGKMTAVKVYANFRTYDVSGGGFIPVGRISQDGQPIGREGSKDHAALSTFAAGALCSNAKLQRNEERGKQTWSILGNASEGSLVVAAAKAGLWSENLQLQYPRLDEVPFTSSRKMMITLHSAESQQPYQHRPEMHGLPSMEYKLPLPADTECFACVKGAPNYILPLCTRVINSDGKVREMTPEEHKSVLSALEVLSSNALRVLAVCIVPFSKMPFSLGDDKPDIEERFELMKRDGIFCGLVGSIDPERAGVKEAVAIARRAGIRVVMITGDYLPTAIAIARNIGLLTMATDKEVDAVDCEKLRVNNTYIPDRDIDEITSHVVVFARAKPEDKLEIVKSFQRQDQVCAMTGDGVNDAPALKQAHIGISMGSGTEVAKSASQVVLLDDAFPTIVRAIEQGRVIYNNIQKFVTFFLATNAAQAIMIFLCVCAGLPLPLVPLQILFVNLATDDWSAITLTLEPGEGRIMDYPPRNINASLIHGLRLVMIGFHWLLLISAMFLVYVIGLYINTGHIIQDDIFSAVSATGEPVCQVLSSSASWSEVVGGDCALKGVRSARTMLFITLCVSENLRVLSVRSFRNHLLAGFLSNKYMLGSITSSLGFMLIVTLTPARAIFGMTTIPAHEWLISVTASLITLAGDEFLKSKLRKRSREKQRARNLEDHFVALMMEVAGLRQHVVNIETELREAKALKLH